MGKARTTQRHQTAVDILNVSHTTLEYQLQNNTHKLAVAKLTCSSSIPIDCQPLHLKKYNKLVSKVSLRTRNYLTLTHVTIKGLRECISLPSDFSQNSNLNTAFVTLVIK